MSYLIKLEVQGEPEEDDRGYPRRKTLTEIEHEVPMMVASAVVSTVMKQLGEAMVPAVQREDP